MKSFDSTPIAYPLPLRLRKADQQLDVRIVIAQPTMLGAIKLCIAAAGFESDKAVYAELEIDAGHWSRIMRAEAHFPVDKLTNLMTLCGNEAPLIWLANSRGYDPRSLRKLESETERELRVAREELARMKSEREVELRLMRELRPTG